jgi:pimeloyl-ACP methyl ester carboxylesterase
MASKTSEFGKHRLKIRSPTMSMMMTKDGTQIYYKVRGTGQHVVFSHGWSLSSAYHDLAEIHKDQLNTDLLEFLKT